MKYMMIVKATKDSEAGVMPSEEMLATMANYNEQLVKAGVLVDATGLQSSSKGFRVRYQAGKKTMVDGPFPETKELIAGYWVIKVNSEQEARDWAMRIPNPYNQDGEVEVRRLFDLDDFGQSDAVEHHRQVEKELAKQKR